MSLRGLSSARLGKPRETPHFPPADVSGANLDNAHLQGANLQDLQWQEIPRLKNANLQDVMNAPTGFIDWPVRNGGTRSGEPIPESPSSEK